jgi:uroporphyrinogen decarboxylase
LLKFPVETREDFAALQWRLDPTDRRRLPADWERLTTEYAVRDYPLGMFVIGSFGQPRNLLGDVNLMMTLYDDPEFIHAIMRHWMEFYCGYIGLVCERVIPDFLMIWEDSCYKNGPLISPESYQEFMAPYLKEIITFARGKGITNFVVDCDGDLRKLIPHFLDCGVNAFFPCEVQSGVDIVALRQQYGKRFALFGGLDKRQLAVSRAAIQDEVARKVPYMLAAGGYFPGIDHGCPPDVSYAHYRYFTELVRDIGPF